MDEYIKNEWGRQDSFKKGEYISELEIPSNLLNEGIYSITIDPFLPPADPDSSFQIRIQHALSFEIIDNFDSNSSNSLPKRNNDLSTILSNLLKTEGFIIEL